MHDLSHLSLHLLYIVIKGGKPMYLSHTNDLLCTLVVQAHSAQQVSLLVQPQ